MIANGENSSHSSTLSSFSSASFLQKTMHQLSSTRCVELRTEEQAHVAVIAIQRYLSEHSEAQQSHSYSYDLTVTDGQWRAKCLLHPRLNHLVYSNTLGTGADISITQCSFVYSERRVGYGYMCIDKLHCGAGSSALLPGINISSLPLLVMHGVRSMAQHCDIPVQVSRKHYLSLWNNDDPEGNIWNSASYSSTVLDVSKVCLLSSLESNFRSSWKPLPLLVKIIHKSRLRYYGKFGLNIDYPYQAYFEVADQSGTMSLVLWNELCPEFYQRLKVGTVLYLQNYSLKQSYSKRSRPQMDHHRLKNFNSVEICLNPHNPASIISVISPKSVMPEWGLPEVSYHFVRRLELDSLANNCACDVIGLVTFVGRIERVKSKGSSGPEKYWTYRWVHAVDGSSDSPFILELFSSSQPEMFNSICPMTYLVCTQMRVCHVDGSLPYLTSSCETETYITGYHKGQPYVNDPSVKSFIQWTKTLKDNMILQKTAMGGHYCYPHPPNTFMESMVAASGHAPLVSCTDLKVELETMQYREHKKVAILGQITAVQYTTRPKSSERRGTQDKQVSVVSADVNVSDDSAAKQTSAPLAGNISLHRQDKRKIHTRKAGHENPEDHQGEVEKAVEDPNQDADMLSWESSSWPKQKGELFEYLCQGGLYQDSIPQRFTPEDKNILLQWSNLHPTRWTLQQTTDAIPPVVCPGYFKVIILGINKKMAVEAAYFPVVSADEPRSVGLPRDPHGNTILSCLCSGFLSPHSNAFDTSQSATPQPEEVLAAAGELEDTDLVCILDLCHLGGDKTEVVIKKVYRVAEVSLGKQLYS